MKVLKACRYTKVVPWLVATFFSLIDDLISLIFSRFPGIFERMGKSANRGPDSHSTFTFSRPTTLPRHISSDLPGSRVISLLSGVHLSDLFTFSRVFR